MSLTKTTLTNRLRVAALSRAEDGARVVGICVIDGDGVVDLRSFDDRGPLTRASDLAPLSELVGQFDEASDVDGLYVVGSERRWFGGRKTRRQAGDPESQFEEQPLSDDA